VYEAGPTGYGLARRALAEGIEIAVRSMPIKFRCDARPGPPQAPRSTTCAAQNRS
jgi:hypothetical protein